MKISVIIPIKEKNIASNEFQDMFKRAYHSVIKANSLSDDTECELIVVANEKTIEQINSFEIEGSDENDRVEIKMVVNDGDDESFQTQVNMGAKEASHDYMSILEVDDFYFEKWFVMVSKYVNEYKDTFDMFLPLAQTIDENGKEQYLLNDIALSYSFADAPTSDNAPILGEISINGLASYFDFHLTGGLINRDVFNELGGFKPEIELSFIYEFLLRFVHNKKRILTLPKIGYVHTIGRTDSLSEKYKNEMNKEEGMKWINEALETYTINPNKIENN